MVAPRRVALIGASLDVEKAGGRVWHYLPEQGPTASVHLVNSRTSQIADRATVASVAELPQGVDVAVVATAAEAVAELLGESALPVADDLVSAAGRAAAQLVARNWSIVRWGDGLGRESDRVGWTRAFAGRRSPLAPTAGRRQTAAQRLLITTPPGRPSAAGRRGRCPRSRGWR